MSSKPQSLEVERSYSATRRLVAAELILLRRDPLLLTFVFAFPIITMLIIGGSFGTSPDDAFPVNPSHWYVASYFSVVIGATGLISIPSHIAGYREQGVLRRLAAAGFPRWAFGLAQILGGLITILVASGALLLTAWLVYGVPAVESPLRVGIGFLVGSIAFVSLGVILGSAMPSTRSAQAVGLLLFFPSFLLGVGGPPPSVMNEKLRAVADVLPLKLVTDSVRDPWLGIGHGTGPLVIVAILGLVAVLVAARRSTL